MKFLEYVKDKRIGILVYFLNLIFSILILYIFEIKQEVILIILLFYLTSGSIILGVSYFYKRNFYTTLKNNLDRLDKKYLILETLPSLKNNEEKIITNILYDINKSMIENVKMYENNTLEFKEFVEMWIHEVKLPIASLVLKCHNNKKLCDAKFLEELRRLDGYTDQILYYVRIGATQKDFVINEVKLADIVRKVILKNKEDILDNNIELEVRNLNISIHTDSKWMEFILNQIINNSIKYKKDNNSKIKIYADKVKNSVILNIWDNGIGIPKKDLKRVFEKTFTGENGRKYYKSTGIGLYIAKALCDKLGSSIEIESVLNEYTCLKIAFEDNSMYNFNE